jgi:hypothetical protein
MNDSTIEPERCKPRLSLAALAGGICVVFFVALMLLWLLDPDLCDDWFAAQTPWQRRFESYIKPAAFAALIAATGLGWIGIRHIRRSSGRRHGMALAVFDILLLPLLVLDMVVLFLWAFMDKILASWRGLDGSMFRNLWEFALWAMLMGTTIGFIDYWVIRPVWSRANHNLRRPESTPTESARTRVNLRRVAIAIAVTAMFLVPSAVTLNESNWKARFGFAVLTGEVRYRVFEANASLVDRLIPAALREDGFNRASRTGDAAAARGKAQTAELDETTVGTLYANASTNSGFLADKRLAGMEVWSARGEAWNYSGQSGSGSGRGGLRLTDKNHSIQLGARYQVSHKSTGTPSPVAAEISYQGEAPPPECARAFMLPFTHDGRDVYLVIAFEVQSALSLFRIKAPGPCLPAQALASLSDFPSHGTALSHGMIQVDWV